MGYENIRLRTIFTTRQLFNCRTKDRTPTLDLSDVIYKFTCSCESCYVGRTSRRLRKRINEHVPPLLLKHMNSVENDQGKENGEDKQKTVRCPKSLTSIGKHLKAQPECARKYNASQFSVLARGRSKFHLQVLEAVYIQSLKPSLCAQKDFVYSTKLFKSHFSLC